jgi:hypothetical protein
MRGKTLSNQAFNCNIFRQTVGFFQHQAVKGGKAVGSPKCNARERKNTVQHSIAHQLAEGVGFEPTVGCPTLDFESSALNRTQPPFLRLAENFER